MKARSQSGNRTVKIKTGESHRQQNKHVMPGKLKNALILQTKTIVFAQTLNIRNQIQKKIHFVATQRFKLVFPVNNFHVSSNLWDLPSRQAAISTPQKKQKARTIKKKWLLFTQKSQNPCKNNIFVNLSFFCGKVVEILVAG